MTIGLSLRIVEGIQISEEFFDNLLCHKNLPIVVKKQSRGSSKNNRFLKEPQYKTVFNYWIFIGKEKYENLEKTWLQQR